MTFGQSSGPPATARQVRELLELLQAAGHLDFRDARGPMGFTQRQAAGKFTRDEADEFIARLQAEVHDDIAPANTSPPARSVRSTNSAGPAPEFDLDGVPAEVLAAELQRRGWVVLEP
jgi:hypothetical protein